MAQFSPGQLQLKNPFLDNTHVIKSFTTPIHVAILTHKSAASYQKSSAKIWFPSKNIPKTPLVHGFSTTKKPPKLPACQRLRSLWSFRSHGLFRQRGGQGWIWRAIGKAKAIQIIKK
jgi:hypothetical protein